MADIDWSQFSDEELQQIAGGSLGQIPDEKLALLAGEPVEKRAVDPFRAVRPAVKLSTALAGGPAGATAVAVNELAPPKVLPAAGAIVGGTLGGFSGGRFGATLGAGLGGAVGKMQEFNRRRRAGETLPTGGTQARQVGLAGGAAALGTLGGAGVGKAFGTTIRAGRGLFKLASEKRMIDLAQRARGGLKEVVEGAGPAFETELGALKGTVDISPTINRLNTAAQDPTFMGSLQKGLDTARKLGDDTLVTFLRNPQAASRATPLQAQRVMNTLRQTPGGQRALQAGRGPFGGAGKGAQVVQRASGEELEGLQFANEIRERLVATFPKAFPAIGQQFRQTAEGFRTVAPFFRQSNLIPNMREGFRSPEIRQAVQQLLPKGVGREVASVRTATKFLKSLPYLVGGGTAAGIFRAIARGTQ